MENIDEEIFAAADKFIDRSAREKKPFFVWFNTTRMRVWTHLKKASDGKTGSSSPPPRRPAPGAWQ
jgi:arylsulfatase A-like enzyme